MRLPGFLLAALSAVFLAPGSSPHAASEHSPGESAAFAAMAQQWRALPAPRAKSCVPDYGAEGRAACCLQE